MYVCAHKILFFSTFIQRRRKNRRLHLDRMVSSSEPPIPIDRERYQYFRIE